MSKQETVKVTLRLPRSLVKFLEDQAKHLEPETANREKTVKEYLEYSIIQSVGADIDALNDGPFKFDYDKTEEMIKEYNLNKILKDTAAREFC